MMVTQGLRFVSHPVAQRSSSAPRERARCCVRRAEGFARLRVCCAEGFGFPENSVEHFAETVKNRAGCAMAQAESQQYR